MDRYDIAKNFLKRYNAENEQIEMPAFFKGYHMLSCIYEEKEKACYLVADRETDEKYLLKIRNEKDGRDILRGEHDRICQLAEMFPKEYRGSIYRKENETEYLLKHYIQGVDLEEYQESNGTLSVQESLRLVIQVCVMVGKLHALTPPVLHRDIKPRNLIIDYRGSLHLIDFETARNYNANKTKDTVFFGTEGNAAPEQYGYSQTDVRTDVYGIGKVLEFLYEENDGWKGGNAGISIMVKRIIEKATAFDPDHRYQSVSKLQKALQIVLKKVDERYLLKKIRIIGMAEIAGAVCLGVFLFMAVRFYKQPAALNESQVPDNAAAEKEGELEENERGMGSLEFSDEPMLLETGNMEDVVKALTGKKDMQQEDYDQITRIAVVGNQIYATNTELEELENIIRNHGFAQNLINGGICDISVLSKMKNLKEVYLCDQRITDISPLEGLRIEKLYLSGNQITDFSVIESLEYLQLLCIVDNPVSVPPDISKCKRLLMLNLSGNTYKNLDFLANSTVGNLNITEIHVENGDFSVLSKMPNLNFLYTGKNQQALYEVLPQLSQLIGLALWEYPQKDLSVVKSLPRLKYMYVTGIQVESMDGIENAIDLEDLAIDLTSITDISGIEKLRRLRYFKIYGNTISDYTPLFNCSSLQIVSVNERQREEIEAMKPDHMFQITDE